MRDEYKFESFYQSTFDESEWQRLRDLEAIAKAYHEAVDHFDATCCTGPVIPGFGKMPATYYQRVAINRNAVECRKWAEKQGKDKGFMAKEVLEAIQIYRETKIQEGAK